MPVIRPLITSHQKHAKETYWPMRASFADHALLADFPVADLMLEVDYTPQMPYSDPSREAEWIVREIIDDYARSLDSTDRAVFLNRLVKLIAERCELEDEASDETAGQIN